MSLYYYEAVLIRDNDYTWVYATYEGIHIWILQRDRERETGESVLHTREASVYIYWKERDRENREPPHTSDARNILRVSKYQINSSTVHFLAFEYFKFNACSVYCMRATLCFYIYAFESLRMCECVYIVDFKTFTDSITVLLQTHVCLLWRGIILAEAFIVWTIRLARINKIFWWYIRDASFWIVNSRDLCKMKRWFLQEIFGVWISVNQGFISNFE